MKGAVEKQWQKCVCVCVREIEREREREKQEWCRPVTWTVQDDKVFYYVNMV